jgi:hypothetical protein
MSGKDWTLRADRALKPLVEQVAAAELRKPSEMLRTFVVEGLERRGLMQRPTLPVADQMPVPPTRSYAKGGR